MWKLSTNKATKKQNTSYIDEILKECEGLTKMEKVINKVGNKRRIKRGVDDIQYRKIKTWTVGSSSEDGRRKNNKKDMAGNINGEGKKRPSQE